MSIPRGLNDQLKNPLVTLRNDLIALRSAFAGMLVASVTNDFASLVDGAGASLDVIVPGAALGDFAFVSLGVDVQGITCSAHVKSTAS